MKSGKSLSELAAEIERQSEAKRDFIADTSQLTVSDQLKSEPGVEARLGDHGVALDVHGVGQFPLQRNAYRQIEDRAKVPAKYAERLRTTHPELYCGTLNYLFRAEPENRMVRTLDGDARAFLSDRFRIIDNDDVANIALPILAGTPDIKVVSAEITDSRMYIKALFPRIEADVAVGDTVQAGVVISNSEIGLGSVRVEPLLFQLRCLNGWIASTALKRHHVGGAHALLEDGDAREVFKDDTLKAADEAFALKLRDVVKSSADEAQFELLVDRMREAKDRKVTGDPVKVIEVTQRTFSLTDDERGSVLTHLIQGGDLTAYGLGCAITRASQDVESYDRATDLERMGGQVIELPQRDWKQIAEAA